MIKVSKTNNRAVLTVYGAIGDRDFSGDSISKHIGELEELYDSIDMHIHTCGGSVFEGNVICNIIKNSKAEIDIYIDGLAASMGAIILTAARRVYIAENGFIMIHRPSSSGNGNAEDMEQYARLLRAMEDDFCRVLCVKTGEADAKIRKLLSGGDHWFTAREAKNIGLVDGITSCIAKDIKQLDGQSAKALTTESLFMKFSASLQKYQNMDFKSELIKVLKLQNNASELEIINAISGLMKTPVVMDQTINRALSLKIITEASVNDLRQWGKASPDSLSNYLATLEKEKMTESRKRADNLFAANQTKLMYITPAVIAGLKTIAAVPENYGTIRKLIDQMPAYTTFNDRIKAATNDFTPDDRSKWTLDDYRKNDPEYLRKNPEIYKQLIEQENKQ